MLEKIKKFMLPLRVYCHPEHGCVAHDVFQKGVDIYAKTNEELMSAIEYEIEINGKRILWPGLQSYKTNIQSVLEKLSGGCPGGC